MDPLVLGAVVAIVTILVLFSGVSVAVGLLIVAAGFLLRSMCSDSMEGSDRITGERRRVALPLSRLKGPGRLRPGPWPSC